VYISISSSSERARPSGSVVSPSKPRLVCWALQPAHILHGHLAGKSSEHVDCCIPILPHNAD
jgi:hypothetical protein